jgi:transcriptional regulator with XRE-family HTH domain
MVAEPPEAEPILIRDALAGRLRSLREQSGKTLRELQAVTYASDSALSRYLAGRAVPPWTVAAALCEQAGTDPAELLPLWRQARAQKRKRRAPARPLLELTTIEKHLARISTEVAAAIREAQARGETVPEHLLTALRLGADATTRLHAARRLISSGAR